MRYVWDTQHFLGHQIFWELNPELLSASFVRSQRQLNAVLAQMGAHSCTTALTARDAAVIFVDGHYRDWLTANVGAENNDWLIGADTTNPTSGARAMLRFRRQDQAMLFKLAFGGE